MIRRRHQQRNLFEAVIGSVEELIDGLIELPLKRLDELLNDEALLDTVMQELAQRSIGAGTFANHSCLSSMPEIRLRGGSINE